MEQKIESSFGVIRNFLFCCNYSLFFFCSCGLKRGAREFLFIFSILWLAKANTKKKSMSKIHMIVVSRFIVGFVFSFKSFWG